MTNDEFPFGKWKGESYKDIPTRYYLWCLENCVLYDTTRKAIVDELGLRGVEIGETFEKKEDE